jgi:release factor glutamine methyltransferase
MKKPPSQQKSLKISQALLWAKSQLKNQNITSYNIDARVLLCHCLSFSKEQVIFNPDYLLNPSQTSDFEELISRRLKREPISHLIGRREFFGVDFLVNSGVLDPRPDSETLIEEILRQFPNKEQKLEIMELGVGSGCLVLSTIRYFSNSKALGVDISQDALKTAKENAKMLKLENRVEFLQSNWLLRVPTNKQFDLIISNPPYIESSDICSLQAEVKGFEPILALDGGDSGLDCYEEISKSVGGFLKKDGILILEIGQNQENAVTELFCNVGLEFIGAKKDLGGIIRCLVFRR